MDIQYLAGDLFAIIAMMIINHNAIKHGDNRAEYMSRFRFVQSVIAYLCIDCLCAVFGLFDCGVLLDISYSFLLFAVYLVLSLWVLYIVDYLNKGEKVRKVFSHLSFSLVLLSLILTTISLLKPSWFFLGDNAFYSDSIWHFIILCIPIVVFFLIVLRIIGMAITQKEERPKHIAIVWCGAAMIGSGIFQLIRPDVHFYSFGFVIACCIIHSYVEVSEHEEQEIREKEQLRKLEMMEKLFASASEDIFSGMLFIDIDTMDCIRVSNENGVFKYEEPKFWNSYLNDLIMNVIPEKREEVQQKLDEKFLKEMVLNQSHSVTYKGKGVYDDGQHRTYTSTAKRVEIDGRPTVIIFTKNISDYIKNQLLINEQLEEERYRAEIASKAKTSFLFNMSHDIRTPMNAVVGYLELLEKNQEDAKKREDYISKIKVSSEMLISILNNILDVARIEKGQIDSEERAWDIESFADSIFYVYKEIMAEKGLYFEKRFNITYKFVFCDIVKLREIFINLISNAYKYTEEGGVTVEIEQRPANREGYIGLVIRVSDTGIGIDEEFLPYVFNEYSREHMDDEGTEGTGLGMNIVKSLVDKMQGTISVSSVLGKGTTFEVNVPCKIADAQEAFVIEKEKKKEHSVVGKKILIAEDNDMNAAILTELLEVKGVKVIRAVNGQHCIDLLSKSDSGYFDMIIMDVHMPVLDGYEATKIIRQMEDGLKANIPIVAFTAHAFKKHREDAMKCGMNGYLAKPIDVNALYETIQEYI